MKQEELDARALVGVVRARAGAGDTDGAVAAGLTAAGAYARIDQPDDVTAVQVLAGDVLQGAGRFDEAEAQYRAALAPPFTFAGRAGAHCGLAELALRGGDLRAAGSRLVRALPYLMGYAYARFDEGTTAIALSLASIDAALGEPSAAAQWVELASALCEQQGDTARLEQIARERARLLEAGQPCGPRRSDAEPLDPKRPVWQQLRFYDTRVRDRWSDPKKPPVPTLAEARAAFQQATAHLDAEGRQAAKEAHGWIGRVQTFLVFGRAEDALEEHEIARRCAQQSGLDALIDEVEGLWPDVLLAVGRLHEARAVLSQQTAELARRRDVRGLGWALLSEAECLTRLRDVDGAIRCYGRCLFAWDLAGERGTKFIRIALTVSQLEVARGDLDAAEEWAHCGTIRARNFSLYALEADSMWERARLRALAAEQGAGGEASRLALRLGRAAADIYIAERAVGSLGSLDLEIATWAVRVGEPAEALRHARRAARIASAVAPAHVGLCRDVIADIEACARGERPARATGVKQRRPRLDAEDWSVMAPSVQRFDVERLYSDNRELDLSLPG